MIKKNSSLLRNPDFLKDEFLINMLKIREENAKKYKGGYSHVFRRKSLFSLIRMACIAFGIELIYAAETGFVSTILLKTGLKYGEMAYVWCIPPVLELIITPIIGSISDRCKSKIGRRRPFIILLSIFLLGGLLLIGYGQIFGYLLGDLEPRNNITSPDNNLDNPSEILKNHKNGAIIIIVGLSVMDTTVDIVSGPTTTFLLEMSPPQDEAKALSTYTLMTSFGGILGYILGGIDWDNTMFSKFFGDHITIIFTIIAILFFITFIITVTSNREIPLRLIEEDSLLRPLDIETITMELNKAKGIEDELDEIPNDSIRYFLKTIFIMPKSMYLLCLFASLGWTSQTCYYLFFTDFVGEAIFKGSPYEKGTEGSENYDKGIRFGCHGLLIHDCGCLIFSIFIEKIINNIGIKWTNVIVLSMNTVSMVVLGLFPFKILSLVLSISNGFLYAVLYTIPNLLLTRYHMKCFIIRNGKCVKLERRRGFGTDINIVSSMTAIAQLIASLAVGSLVGMTNNTSFYMFASSGFSFLGAISAFFLLYLD